MQTSKRDIFTTIHTEGAILPSDLLQRISEAHKDIEGLSPEAYHLAPNEKINEAINRSWTRLLGAWEGFQSYVLKLREDDIGTTITRSRWLLPLFQELGYGQLQTAKAFEIDGKSYPISHLWQNTPIHLVGFRVDLDKRTARVAGAARTNPHGLLQEFLNRSENHLWGFVSNGYKLRVLRDNVSLTRQAYVEFDLQAMMDGEVYSDFVILWLLCHQSRVEAERPEQCWLEKWSQAAMERGTRALEHLRDGVQEAIKALGRGFLEYRGNQNLKDKLKSGELKIQDYYHQLLRVVYRLLFLFVAEDRALLLNPTAPIEAKERYRRYYSTSRLRHLAEKRRGTHHPDLWIGLSLVFKGLSDDKGCPELALPALGSFLWSDSATPDLDKCIIANSDLLNAIRALAFITEGKTLRYVDFKNLGTAELGSVYESLLELHPDLNAGAGKFELKTVAGHERKTTGSYYTPASLVNCLLDSALDPVLEEAAKKDNPEEAILDLKICDPACGSGHFLIAAAHRIAKRLASVRTGDEEPSPEETRKALRDVIGKCIHGVDINPMAVELCKISLWMEAVEPGKPLSFLEHRIQCGNSLLGATPALLEKGIPDEAFKPIEGDDKEYCKELRKRNKEEREKRQKYIDFDRATAPWDRLGDLARGLSSIDDIPDDSIEGIKSKNERYAQYVKSQDYKFGRLWADAWCAAFVCRKVKDNRYVITEGVFRDIEKNPFSVESYMRDEIARLADEYKLFHWHIAFPDVFRIPGKGDEPENEQPGWCGGFDVVLGNPPWERIKLQEKEWFAERCPEVAEASNAAARKRLIQELQKGNPGLYDEFIADLRKAEGESVLVRDTERFPLCGRGDVNTYAVFAELKRQLINPAGRVGCIVPSGIVTDDTTKYFFKDLMDEKSLVSLYDFENRSAIFPGVHRSYKFCLLTLTGYGYPMRKGADFVFFALGTGDLFETDRRISLTAEDIALLNPNTKTCPVFRSKRDADLNKVIYKEIPILIADDSADQNEWGIYYLRLVHLGDHQSEVRSKEQILEMEGSWCLSTYNGEDNIWLPLYESKMVLHFDHRYATFDGTDQSEAYKGNPRETLPSEHQDAYYIIFPRYWVREPFFLTLMAKYPHDRKWLLGYRDITNSTNERTCIAMVIPCGPATVSFPTVGVGRWDLATCLLGNLSSHVLDYTARQKCGMTHLAYHIFKQLPVLNPSRYAAICPWQPSDIKSFIQARVIEIVYTSWDLEPFAKDCGYTGPPYRWDEERRFLIRCELDAAYFYLYGIERDDVDYIMETFPIVKRKDEKKYGEYRTKRVILEIYDAMASSIRTGTPYQTILSPPPADPSLCHPPRGKQ